MQFTEYLVGQAVDSGSYVTVALCVAGLLGNIACARVMLEDRFRQLSSSVFLFCLAIVDSMVLVVEGLDDLAVRTSWFDSDNDVIAGNGHGGQWRCRAVSFLGQASRIAGSWLVVALAIEAATANPTRAAAATAIRGRYRVVRTRSRALHVSMTVILLSVAGAFPLLVITKVSDSAGVAYCSSKYAVFRRLYSHLVLSVGVDVVAPTLLIVLALGTSLTRHFRKDQNHNVRLERARLGVAGIAAAVAGVTTRSPDQWSYRTTTSKRSLSLKSVIPISVAMLVSLLPYAYLESVAVSNRLRTPGPLDIALSPSSYFSPSHISAVPIAASSSSLTAYSTGSSTRERFLISVARTLLVVNYAAKFFILLAFDGQVRSATSSLMACGRRRATGSRASRSGHSAPRAETRWVTDSYDVTGKEVSYSIPVDRLANYDSGLMQPRDRGSLGSGVMQGQRQPRKRVG